MASIIFMPKYGMTMKHGTVEKWMVEEGARVEAGTAIAEIMTEKITNELAAPESGVLLKILVAKGEKAAVGTPIAVLGEPGEDFSELLKRQGDGAPKKEAAESNVVTIGAGVASTRVTASPAARKLAEELGVDLSRVTGSGAAGRITREDVLAAEATGGFAADDRPVRQTVEYAGMRRAIGEHMAMSWTLAPKVTHHGSVDVSAMMSFRASLNAGRKDKDKVSVTAILVKTVATALEKMPQINATLDGDVIRLWEQVNVGVAMAIPEGLIVPVVRDANQKGFNEIGREIVAFGRKVARNRLEPDELTGGTFTVTNVGGYGSVDWFTPIINQPESAILGIGRTVQSVVAVDGAPAIRPTMGLSLSFDHRVIDGAPAASFLAMVMGLLKNPYAMVP